MTVQISSVVHVTSWLSRQGGGIPPVIWALADTMQKKNISTSVVGLQDQWIKTDCSASRLSFKAGKIVGPQSFGFSPELKHHLHGCVRKSGVVHSHGLWMYPGIAARNCARQTRNPLIISPHGMLEPWAMNNSRLKKQLAGVLFEKKNLRSAGCLHALCAAEANHFRQLGLTNPIAIIPNGVELHPLEAHRGRETLTEQFPELKGRLRALFLSRLHPKKGLDNLLRAWKNLENELQDWSLMIAGSGQPAYEEELRSLVRHLALDRSVIFLGPVFGDDKARTFAAADAFLLPSFSEGFSMAILEAAAAGLPVLLTHECNFPELTTAGAAIEITASIEGVESGLRQICNLSHAQRDEMGKRGMNLVKQSYTWPTVAGQMVEVYEWLLGNGSMPKFVYK